MPRAVDAAMRAASGAKPARSRRAKRAPGEVAVAGNGSIRIDGVLDIETEDWSKFVLGRILTASGDVIEHRDPDAMFDAVLGFSGQLWCWGDYDILWCNDLLAKRKIRYKPRLGAGGKISRIDVPKSLTAAARGIVLGGGGGDDDDDAIAAIDGVSLRNAMAMIPLALADAARLAGKEKTDPDLPCVCGEARPARPRGCGGYCSIRRGMSETMYRRISDYLGQDCACEIAALEAWIDYAARHGITLASTIGQTAWKTATTDYGIPTADWEPSHYRFARKGYFGGRCQLFRPEFPNEIHRYDVNSAYPAALATLSLPTGDPGFAVGAAASRVYARGREGIYEASVEVPRDHFLPPLPTHTGDRVSYLVGRVKGFWTGLELRAAEASGAQIAKIVSCLVWGEDEPIFRPFVRKFWKLRDAAIRSDPRGKGGAWAKLLKLVPNSVTGKLAQRAEGEDVVVHPDDDEIRICPETRPCSPTRCSKRCGAWRPIGRSGVVYAVPRYRLPECGHIHWAAYLTAWTRIEWRAEAISDGEGGRRMIYGDTDSVFSSVRLTRNLGDQLGQWGYEGSTIPKGEAYVDEDGEPQISPGWIAVGPKAYTFIDRSKRQRKAKLKGVSDVGKHPADWDRFAAGETIAYSRGAKTFKTAVRAPEDEPWFVKKKITRTNRADKVWYGDRRLDPADGITYPTDWDHKRSD